MALKISGKFKSHGINWRSGHIYRIGHYTGWREDSEPLIVLLYKVYGDHPRTGHRHNYLTAINLNYVPRHVRRNFAINWTQTLERNNGNVLLTWKDIKRKYPGLAKSDAIRRYLLSPRYYLKNIEHIPIENMEEAVISSWHKDYSKKIKMALTRKRKSAEKKRKQRTDDKGIGKILNTIFPGKKK